MDFCVAMDMSGSVCSPADYVTSCEDCPEDCQEVTLGFGKSECCSNWVKQVNFTKAFFNTMDEVSGGIAQQFSIVAFSTAITQSFPLATKGGALDNLGDLTYVGGWTNTGDAIKACYETMKNSYQRTRVIVVLTDGTATAGHSESDIDGSEENNARHQLYAVGQAENAQDAQIIVIPVAVKTSSLNLDKLRAIATDPSLLVEVDNFAGLENSTTINQLVANAKCSKNTADTNEVLQGEWVRISSENFEAFSEVWTIIDNNRNSASLTTARVRENNVIDCPYANGDWCIAMHGDSVTDNLDDSDDSMLLSDPCDITDAKMVRVQFDYRTQNWHLDDHFHLDYKTIKNGVTDEQWTEHTYQIAINFNNDITGTMEKWFKIPEGAQGMIFRFHMDAEDQTEYKLFLDNIVIDKLMP
jgi:hypothetical protein